MTPEKEFCPNCEAETPCTHEAELYVCDICGEDFAKYIVSRNCNVSDVSTTQDVITGVKTGKSVENTNPDYYKDEGAGVSEQYGCPDCNYVEYIDKIPIQCPICGHTSMERLRWTKGGDGSHWEGCADVHWDCKIAQLEDELARRNEERNALADDNRMLSERIQRLVDGAKSRDEIIARLKEDGESLASVVTGGVTQDAEEYWECPYCMAMAYNAGDIHHTPDCPITLHRSLMKEIER